MFLLSSPGSDECEMGTAKLDRPGLTFLQILTQTHSWYASITTKWACKPGIKAQYMIYQTISQNRCRRFPFRFPRGLCLTVPYAVFGALLTRPRCWRRLRVIRGRSPLTLSGTTSYDSEVRVACKAGETPPINVEAPCFDQSGPSRVFLEFDLDLPGRTAPFLFLVIRAAQASIDLKSSAYVPSRWIPLCSLAMEQNHVATNALSMVETCANSIKSSPSRQTHDRPM